MIEATPTQQRMYSEAEVIAVAGAYARLVQSALEYGEYCDPPLGIHDLEGRFNTEYISFISGNFNKHPKDLALKVVREHWAVTEALDDLGHEWKESRDRSFGNR